MAPDTVQWPAPPPDWAQARLGDVILSSTVHVPASHNTRSRTEIHVWALCLDIPPEYLAALAQILSPAERERAARFHFDRHRNRFIAGRGALRTLLAQYLQAEPHLLAFSYGPQGKPALAAPFAASGLTFNLAHSEALALLAVTRGCQLGVDVERVRPLQDAEDLVARFFSPRENDRFRALLPEQKPAAFFRLWTRKEAWLKATGEGIAHSLHRVEVSFLPDEAARLLSLPESLAQGLAWTLVDLAPRSGFAGALAVGAEEVQVRCWQVQEALLIRSLEGK